MRCTRRHGVAAALTATLAFAVPAATAQALWYSVVVPPGNVTDVFTAPTLSSATTTSLQNGVLIDVICQTRGGVADGGTSLWDYIDSPTFGYVLDLYVSTPNTDQPSPGLPGC